LFSVAGQTQIVYFFEELDFFIHTDILFSVHNFTQFLRLWIFNLNLRFCHWNQTKRPDEKQKKKTLLAQKWGEKWLLVSWGD